MVKLVPQDIRFFSSPEAFRDWLDANHATHDELWLGYRTRESGLPTLTWEQAVDEALCYGWIDGVRMRVEGGSAQRFTPRRPRSIWSGRNVGRVEALIAEGRMRPAGLAAYRLRTPERTAVYSFEREAAAFDSDAEEAFRSHAEAWAFWERQPPGYRRQATHWVVSAKRPETRAKRLATLIEDSAAGRRIGMLARPAPNERSA